MFYQKKYYNWKKKFDITSDIINLLNNEIKEIEFLKWNRIHFFKKKPIVRINDILNILNLKKNSNNSIINDIKTLDIANKNDITFFHSIKYKNLLDKTKSNYILTTKKNSNLIPKKKIQL